MRKPIKRFPEYLVSDFWKVMRNNKFIKPFVNKNSWQLRVTLQSNWTKKNFLISRLVYCTFNDIDIMYNWKDLVCHKDDNLNNNKLSNLFIGTQSDNMIDCKNKWRLVVPILKWELSPTSKLKEQQVKEILKMYKEWYLQYKIAKQYNVSKSTINAIISWRIWNHVSL